MWWEKDVKVSAPERRRSRATGLCTCRNLSDLSFGGKYLSADCFRSVLWLFSFFFFEENIGNLTTITSAYNSIHICAALRCVSRGRERGVDQMRVQGYILMPPVLEPMARIFCTGSKAKEVGW